MHVQTNRWNEQRTGHQIVGCSGFDDPIYESYTYTKSCSEDVMVFDTPQEKKEFHEMVVSLASQAQEIVNKRIDQIVEQHMAAWRNDLLEYVREQRDFQERSAGRSWIARMFTSDHAPYEMPMWTDYKNKALRTVKEDKLVVAARLILTIPEEYNLFIEKLLADDYKRIVALVEQLKEGIKV